MNATSRSQRFLGILTLAGAAAWGCHTSTQGVAGGGTDASAGNSGTVGGAGGGANPGGGASGGGMSGATADAGQSAGGAGAGGAGGAVVGGAGGVASCTPGVEQTLITDCGYPTTTSSPLSSVIFNESEVLRAIVPSGGAPTAVVRVFYNDEHALTLGVRQVVTKGPGGMMMTTDYPLSPLSAVPSSVMNPQTGTNELVGPQSGLDVSLRPMWPALFITDITADPKNRSGDWQMGGRPINPNAIYGTWKGAVRTVDTGTTPSKITITPDKDPMKNSWNLGGGDPVPAGLKDEGYGTEVVWNVPLTPGHSYRIQTMVHDGDQNKAGGDSGEACVLFCAGGSGGPPPVDAGAPPPPMCPNGSMPCGQDAIDPAHCPASTVCANGCCIPLIP